MDFLILPGPTIEDYNENGVCLSVFTGIVLSYRKIHTRLFSYCLEQIEIFNQEIKKNFLNA